MNLEEFNRLAKQQQPITAGTQAHKELVDASALALKMTFQLNSQYHEAAEVRNLFSKLTGRKVPSSFLMFPPFYTDHGKNIVLGENIFINTGCTFQDKGGIFIGDGTQIGQNVTLVTLNHGLLAEDRNTTYPYPIIIGKNVWIGAGATLLPGVTIGDHVIIGAGSVVTKSVESRKIIAGVPATVLKNIDQ